jgi:putative FmdB family regulatory protein
MPIYEYLCQACGHGLEVMQKLSDPVLTDCPACHKAELKKQISAAGFQLKGSGWYATDFKNNGKKKDTETKSDSGTETKSAGGCGSGTCGCH